MPVLVVLVARVVVLVVLVVVLVVLVVLGNRQVLTHSYLNTFSLKTVDASFQ